MPTANPEICRAVSLGIPVSARGEVLPCLLEGHRSVAVGGTHGKTTTSTFVASILESAGRDPVWCIGGISSVLGGVAGPDGESPFRSDGNRPMVVEADESDGTIALYRPDIAVLTNVQFDHMEHFDGVEEFEECFRRFIVNAGGKVIYCLDDPRAASLCCGRDDTLSYGLSACADIAGSDLEMGREGVGFRVSEHGKSYLKVDLPVPGRHNVLNALAAICVAREFGLTVAEIRDGLHKLKLPARRFEKVVHSAGVQVVSDYAHHPAEIAALVSMARDQGCKRILAVFQPHRYTRTRALGDMFPAAFEGVDELVLTPVYAASEAPLVGGMVEDLHRHFVDSRVNGLPHVQLAASPELAWKLVSDKLRDGDLLLVVGAGDIERVAHLAAEELG